MKALLEGGTMDRPIDPFPEDDEPAESPVGKTHREAMLERNNRTLKAEVEEARRSVEWMKAQVREVEAEVERLRAGNREMWNATSKTEAEIIQENGRLRSFKTAIEAAHAEHLKTGDYLRLGMAAQDALLAEEKSKSQLKRENVQAGRDVLDGTEES
jgi:multidrug resistance efflux pump